MKKEKSKTEFLGKWHIYEMSEWDEGYFNMEVQAYIKIDTDSMGSFQFGLVKDLSLLGMVMMNVILLRVVDGLN
ncbi:MAG: hypothetical protein FD167_6059 [bacterium]|nr:MAG: hypothetical protein FD167_6059 [bacterium]